MGGGASKPDPKPPSRSATITEVHQLFSGYKRQKSGVNKGAPPHQQETAARAPGGNHDKVNDLAEQRFQEVEADDLAEQRAPECEVNEVAEQKLQALDVSELADHRFRELDVNKRGSLCRQEMAVCVPGTELVKAFQQMAGESDLTRADFVDWFNKLERDQGSKAAFKLLNQMGGVQQHMRAAKKAANDLLKKGFTLGQLLDFVNEKCHKLGLITEKTKTFEVVRDIIIPETKEKKCCYADILPGGPVQAEILMSHWWGNNFLHLVRACCELAAGKTELFSHMYTEKEKAVRFWLCIFGVNQHVSICGTKWNPCDCGSRKIPPTEPEFQMDKFPLIMGKMRGHGLAMDLKLTTLTRVWVLSELDEAMTRLGLNTKFCGEVDPEILRNPVIPSVADAQATVQEDRDRIVGNIERRPDGIALFDKQMGTKARREITRIRLFQNVAFGSDKIPEIQKDLNDWPDLLDERNTRGRGETLLMMAARFGHVQLAELFISKGASPMSRTDMDWTPLHYAAICFNLDAQTKVVELLLDRYRKHATEMLSAVNSFGRTPLHECLHSAGSRHPATGLLRDKVQQLGLVDLICTAQDSRGFKPMADDARLFSHWCLRQDSWDRPDLVVKIRQPIGGQIEVFSLWVKPIDFGTRGGEIINCGQADQIFHAAVRLAEYIRYRWPLWEFHRILFRYTTSKAPQHYLVNLREETFCEYSDEMSGHDADRVGRSKFDVMTRLVGSIRFLYP
mmetsp:Transcript_52780/g.120085  ORF Transcript_52780/g.120085 Transcript_52780/m.120085 type:complete len:735 (+) Transcript_52780:43-2247(+)